MNVRDEEMEQWAAQSDEISMVALYVEAALGRGEIHQARTAAMRLQGLTARMRSQVNRALRHSGEENPILRTQ